MLVVHNDVCNRPLQWIFAIIACNFGLPRHYSYCFTAISFQEFMVKVYGETLKCYYYFQFLKYISQQKFPWVSDNACCLVIKEKGSQVRFPMEWFGAHFKLYVSSLGRRLHPIDDNSKPALVRLAQEPLIRTYLRSKHSSSSSSNVKVILFQLALMICH